MSPVKVMLGILLFAIAAAVLYAWGMKKSMRQKSDLLAMLDSRAAKKILHALGKKDCLSLAEIEALVGSVSASEFYSKQKAIVRDKKTFARRLSERMCAEGLLKKETERGQTVFRKA